MPEFRACPRACPEGQRNIRYPGWIWALGTGLYGAVAVKGSHYPGSHSLVRPALRAFFRPDRGFVMPSRAGAVKDGAFERRRRLVLDGPEHGGRMAAIGIESDGDPRGARIWCAHCANHACIRWTTRDPNHEAVMRFASKAPRRRVHSLGGVTAIAGRGLPPPRIDHRQPRRAPNRSFSSLAQLPSGGRAQHNALWHLT